MKGLAALGSRFDALAPRERGLIFAAVLVILIAGWSALFLSPYQKFEKAHRERIVGLQQQIQALNLQQQAILERAKADPNRALRAREQELRAAMASLDDELAERTGDFVPPRRVAEMLEDLLRAQDELQLVSLSSLPSARIEIKNQPEAAALYRHGIEVVFEGEYLATMRFLETLEELRWRLFWDRLDYEVQEYPKARVRLRIHTLSTEEGWLGV